MAVSDTMTPASTASPRRAMWVVLTLVALAVAACAAIVILLPPARIRAMARAQLAAALARDVRFRDASLSWWPPVGIRVTGLELAEPGGFRNGAAFQVQALQLDLDLLALFGGRVRVRRLVLDHPQIHVVLRPDGTTNLDGLARPPAAGRPPPRPMDLDLRELRIADGRVLIDAMASARRVTFQVASRLGLETRRGGTRVTTSGRTEVTDFAYGPLTTSKASDL